MPFNNAIPQFGTAKSGQSVSNPKQKIAVALAEQQKNSSAYQAPNLANALNKKKKKTNTNTGGY